MITFRQMCRAVLVGAGCASIAACDLDLENPNAPSSEQVVSSADGVLAVTVGMQAQFAQSIEDYITPSSLATDEWGTRTRALISWITLFTGENFDQSFVTVSAPYSNSFQVIRSANTALQGAETVQLGTATSAGVRATARLFKAMALGWLIQIYEKVPVDVSAEGAPPVERAQVLSTILELLEQARTDLSDVSDADLATFRSRALGPGVNLRNTIDAMLARYYLMDGKYAEAIAAADRVNPAVLSVLEYPAPTRNPIENLAFQLEYVGGLQSFVAQAEPGDRRPAYWVNAAAAALPANPSDSVVKPLKKYSTPNEPFPLYLPDEMKLIKAEALARTGQFGQAAALVNAVRTQTSSPVDEPVAGLPPLPASALDTEAELLAQIARERRYELYMQGLRWEDTRRFGAALTTEPTFPFLPLPLTECQVNPNSGC
jgi:Ni,Fe-hydrogenase III small subunit